jgi:hypothetical protein
VLAFRDQVLAQARASLEQTIISGDQALGSVVLTLAAIIR